MSNFIWDNTALEAQKSNLNPLPNGSDPTKWVQATDWNGHRQALLDAQTAVRGNVRDIRKFGAQLDGVTDDTASIQAALDSLQSTGRLGTVLQGTVFVPEAAPNQFAAITKPLFMDTPGVQLMGIGRESSVIGNHNTYVGPILVLMPPASGNNQLQTGTALATGGGVSMSCQKTAGNYLSVSDAPALSTTARAFLDGFSAFTFRFFLKPNTTSAAASDNVFGCFGPTTGMPVEVALPGPIAGISGVRFGITGQSAASGNFRTYAQIFTTNGQVSIGGTTDHPLGATYYVSVEYDGANFAIYINGINEVNAACTGNVIQMFYHPLNIGGGLTFSYPSSNGFANSVDGFIDSFEILNTRLHTSNYTPPTAKHTASANTQYLQNFTTFYRSAVVGQVQSRFAGLVNFYQIPRIDIGTPTNGFKRVRDLSLYNNHMGPGIFFQGTTDMSLHDLYVVGYTAIKGHADSFSHSIRNIRFDDSGGYQNSNAAFEFGAVSASLSRMSSIWATGGQAFCGISGGYEARITEAFWQPAFNAEVGMFLNGQFNAHATFDNFGVDGEGTWNNYQGLISASGPATCLKFDSCYFESKGIHPTDAPILQADKAGGRIVFEDCSFTQTNVDTKVIGLQGTLSSYFRISNRNPHQQTSPTVPWASAADMNFIELTGPDGIKLAPQWAGGLSAGAVASANLRGQVTVSGAATTATNTFGTAEADASYNITLTPVSSTGTPAAGSNRVLSVSKLGASFTVTVEAAPGVGNTVTFDWKLIR